MKRIAVIPARSGSKGLKDKNIRMLCGKPLLAYSAECAIRSGKFDRVFVSTDSQQYARIASAYGADASFLRSAENASDTAGSWDAVREVIGAFEEKGIYYDEVMLLQATSPLREPADIDRCIELLHEKNALAVESVTETGHSPLLAGTLPEDGSMDGFFRTEYCTLPRQLLPKFYRENGAVYLVKREVLDKPDREMFLHGCYAYVMPAERSVDIDTELDFKMAEFLMGEAVH